METFLAARAVLYSYRLAQLGSSQRAASPHALAAEGVLQIAWSTILYSVQKGLKKPSA
jgi:hypothetical protein